MTDGVIVDDVLEWMWIHEGFSLLLLFILCNIMLVRKLNIMSYR